MHIIEKNYDFLKRHWCYHKPNMRDAERFPLDNETLIDDSWRLGCPTNAPQMFLDAVRDFQDYLLVSMGLSLPITRTPGEKVLWLDYDAALDKGFVLEVETCRVMLSVAGKDAYRAVVYLEDCMSLEQAPVLAQGHFVRRPLYDYRVVHSGSGIDNYPDAELAALVHAGYDGIAIFLEGIDKTSGGRCNVKELIDHAESFGLCVMLFNYIQTFIHPDEPNAQECYDKAYGELFRHYPKASSIFLCGESLEFPSKDPATSGVPFNRSVVDGIPDTRPSPGWYPCSDYPQYLSGIEQAIHKASPTAEVIFETYNWGYAPVELRKHFLDALPKGKFTISVCYEIFAQKTLEGLKTPVMDYTCSTNGPSYYFTSECECAKQAGHILQGNTNTGGIGWDFGTVPYVPVPWRWLDRNLHLREAHDKWGLVSQYATHHYGWWDSVAADVGRWASWEDFQPDYDELLRKVARRDYGKKDAQHVLNAWRIWGDAMNHYVASNEDQYGPWRVGPAYPFIFQPDITRTMESKEIKFPADPEAHFGSLIIKTLYHPFENENQTPGFLRYPAELRSLERMLELWNEGVAEAEQCADTENGQRLIALGRFIRNSVITVMNIKRWWLLTVKMQASGDRTIALECLDGIEKIAHAEIENVRDTIPAVETDSRLGWEPSMEYVCDRWHLEWKIRQVESALREIAAYRRMILL